MLDEQVSANQIISIKAELTHHGVPYRGVDDTSPAVQGSEVTTFKIGGPLSLLILPGTAAQVVCVLEILARNAAPLLVLGEGSNLLISDDGIKVPVVRPRARELIIADDGQVEVDAGYPIMSLSRQMSETGFAGLEFAGGIPGSLGGAAFMNAGAHGSEFAQVVQWVEVAFATGIERISAQSLAWNYRNSGLREIFARQPGVVVRIGLKLVPADATQTREQRAKFLAHRRETQPLQAASAGSIFRNPSATVSAGSLIERCGFKGSCEGGALVSPLHANWIINPERKARAVDVQTLLSRIQDAVQRETGVVLHEELVKW